MNFDRARFDRQMSFLAEIDKMKGVLRQTLLIDCSRRENDAEHSWHFALMAMTLEQYAQSENLDMLRVLKMALVHDLVEVDAGDTFAYDAQGYQSKKRREDAAADRIFGLLPKEQGDEYRALWEEFDRMETPEALYASAVDRLQPFMHNCLTNGHTWRQHEVSAGQVYRRMEPIFRAMPNVRGYIEENVQEAVRLGYLKP